MISEFELWLRSRTSKEKPFHEETILANAKAARALDAWMTRKKIDGGFTTCDTAVLNGFFRDYNAAHTCDGTNRQSAQPTAPVQLAGGRLQPSPSRRPTT